MARRGKYTVGLPRPGPNPEEIVRRYQNVVLNFGAQMANNYLNGIRAVASSPAMLSVMAAKLREWFNAFFGAGVPAAYRAAITPALQQYRARLAGLVAAPPPAVAPAPAPIVPAPAPLAR